MNFLLLFHPIVIMVGTMEYEFLMAVSFHRNFKCKTHLVFGF